MKYKPHIRLEDGIWHLYSRRTAQCSVIMARKWDRFVARCKKRHDQLTKAEQDRRAGDALRRDQRKARDLAK